MQLACVKCGHQWGADKEPIRCANNDCRSRGWRASKSVQRPVVDAASSVQASKVDAVEPEPRITGKRNFDGVPTSDYRQCRECGKEFRSTKDTTAMVQHVDHLVVHQWQGWGTAYERIIATRKKVVNG
jgi:hypothetical protein